MEINHNKKGSYNFLREPLGIVRWGNSLVLICFLLIMIFASIFSFNEVLQGEVVVTSENPPVQIIAERTGKISGIFFKAGDSIAEGEVLGILENNADDKDVIFLKKKLENALPVYSSTEILDAEFPGQLNLGTSIQPFYNSFLNTYRRLIMDYSLREDIIHSRKFQEQLSAQNKSLQNKEQELLLTQQTLLTLERNLERYQKLFNKGVVSQYDLEKVENIYLDEKRKFYSQDQQFNQLLLERSALEKDQLLITNSDFKNFNFQEAELILAQQNLLNQINSWEETFLLTSPIHGKLSYNNIWGRFQAVELGEVVFTVTPFDRQKLIGKCRVPIQNSGKIQKGQQVFLKLDNHPYREWGMVKASVNSVSAIQTTGNETGYVVYLAIEDLTTSYGKELILNQELVGTAEILLEKSSILNRIFYQFRSLWAMEKNLL